jgi:hypothetical protein
MTALAGGPATSLREREGGRELVVSRSRQSDRGLWAVACSRQPEMREDPVNDGGVVDRGSRLPAAALADRPHSESTTDNPQSVEIDSRAAHTTAPL